MKLFYFILFATLFYIGISHRIHLKTKNLFDSITEQNYRFKAHYGPYIFGENGEKISIDLNKYNFKK